MSAWPARPGSSRMSTERNSSIPFRAKPMKLSVFTAALQELTPRAVRDADPDRAVEEWLEFARELDCPYIELSTALTAS